MARPVKPADWERIAPPPPALDPDLVAAAERRAATETDAAYLRRLFREQN